MWIHKFENGIHSELDENDAKNEILIIFHSFGRIAIFDQILRILMSLLSCIVVLGQIKRLSRKLKILKCGPICVNIKPNWALQ